MAEEETHETHEMPAEENPKPETQAEHPESAGEHARPHDDLRDTVHALSEKVSLLETTVQGLMPENRDESPVKRPWTHRGFGEKR